MSSVNKALKRFSAVLGFTLDYQNGSIVGSADATLNTDFGLSIPFTPRATYLCDNDTVGVLFDVIGDLGMFLGYFEKTDTVSVYLLDKARLKAGKVEDMLGPDMKLIDAVRKLRRVIILSFYQKNGEWKSLSLPT